MLVKSLSHLISLSSNKNGDFEDFYILIANGLAKSSKRILYHHEFDMFSMINEVDESYQEFKSSEISKETNLIKAIRAKTLFKL